MRTHDNGAGFSVSFSRADANDFTDSWPCSTVCGSGWFAFAENGDLVDCHPLNGDGDDWLAFSHDCQRFGFARIDALRRRHARQRKGGAR